MKAFRVSMMACMCLYFAASCIAFSIAAAYVLPRISASIGVAILRSLLLLFITELVMAILFGVATCASAMGWKTRNRWGVAVSLLSFCVPLLMLSWGVSMFWHYLLGCLWPAWLFGAIGLILFPKAGSPHSLSHDLRMILHAAQVPVRRGQFPNR